MRSSALLLLRTLIVLLFLITMPLLALPPFTRYVGTLLDSAWETVPQRFGFANTRNDALAKTSEPPAALTNTDVRPLKLKATPVTVAHHSSSDGQINQNSSDDSLSLQEQKDRIAVLHKRLTGLGATHANFESYGDGDSKNRFVCEFPIKDSVYRRRFVQEDTNPLLAMQRVLDEVESWHRSGTLRLEAANTKASILR